MSKVLSVILVNLNGGAMLLSCLRALYSSISRIACDVVVVDNGSDDGSPDRAAREFPGVVLIRNSRNEGFARAVNQGMVASQSRFVLLLNNDTEVEQEAIPQLISFMERTPECGIAGAQLFNPDGGRQHSFDVVPSLVTEVVNKSLLKRLFPGRFPSKLQERTDPLEVESLIGAAFMIRRAVLDRVGLLDERFFFCLEETDLCVRARQAGWKAYLVPSSRVMHLQGATKARSPVRGRIEYYKSLLQFFVKHYGLAVAAMLRVWLAVKAGINFFVLTMAVALTLGLFSRWLERWIISAGLFLWHLMFCPSWMGLTDGRRHFQYNLLGSRLWCIDRDQNNHGSADLVLDFDTMVKSGTVVKDLRIKRTLECASAGRVLLVKQYKYRGWLDRLKFPKALKEVRVACRVADRGIEPVLPLAGMWDGRDGFLITEKLQDWSPLNHVLLDGNVPPGPRRSLLYEYGRYARQIHDAGVFQYDFDPNNIMVRRNGLRNEFRLVDFEKTSVHYRLSEDRRMRSLAKTNRIGSALTRTDRLRFLKGYMCLSLSGYRDWKDVAGKILLYGRLQRERDKRRLVRNCVAENRNFGRFSAAGRYGYYRKKRAEAGRNGFLPDEIHGLLDSAEALKFLDAAVCDDIAEAWPQANVRAKEGGAVPVLAVAKVGERSGTVYYYKLLDPVHRTT